MTSTKRQTITVPKKMYTSIGVDTDAAIETLKSIPVSLHCWQGDDVLDLTMMGH